MNGTSGPHMPRPRPWRWLAASARDVAACVGIVAAIELVLRVT